MSSFIEGGLSSANGADNFIKKDLIITGNVIWVDSVAGNDANPGTKDHPLATLSQAITNAIASNGDIIVIKSGYTQLVSSSININKAGLKIFGLGSGSLAPKFTATAAVDVLNITGVNVEINNFYFPAGITVGNTARINIDAGNVKIKGCTFLCGAFDQTTITITSLGLYAKVESCIFTVTADGPDSGILVEAAATSGLEVLNSSFNGGADNWDDAAIFSAFAHKAFVYDSVTLTNNAIIKHTITTAKGWVSNATPAEASFISLA